MHLTSRFGVICMGGMNDQTYQIPEVEIYNFENNLWYFGESLSGGEMMSFDLLADPYGGVLLLGSGR